MHEIHIIDLKPNQSLLVTSVEAGKTYANPALKISADGNTVVFEVSSNVLGANQDLSKEVFLLTGIHAKVPVNTVSTNRKLAAVAA